MERYKKRKLYYLSTSSFAQVDVSVLHLLTEEFDITYGVIFSKVNTNFFEDELKLYCHVNSIKFEAFRFLHRERDIRIGFELVKVLKHIRSTNPDIIYTFSFDNPMFGFASLILNKAKTIVFIHDVEFHSSHSFKFFLKIGRFITTRHFTFFHVFSQNQKILFEQSYPRKVLYFIPLAVSKFGISDSSERLRKKTMNFTSFLFFGKILPYKGLTILIEAVKALSTNFSNFELVIAGQCDNWETLYAPLINGNSFFKTIIRRIENAEISNLFCECHYLVLPYKDATQSGPLMIAYAYDTPVIASDIVAFKETVKNEITGYLFDHNVLQELINVMTKVIHQDQHEYLELIKKLNGFIESNFSTEIISKKYIDMFNEIA